jgi:hypothetical protein
MVMDIRFSCGKKQETPVQVSIRHHTLFETTAGSSWWMLSTCCRSWKCWSRFTKCDTDDDVVRETQDRANEACMNEWVFLATCKQLVWSTRIDRNIPIWILLVHHFTCFTSFIQKKNLHPPPLRHLVFTHPRNLKDWTKFKVKLPDMYGNMTRLKYHIHREWECHPTRTSSRKP